MSVLLYCTVLYCTVHVFANYVTNFIPCPVLRVLRVLYVTFTPVLRVLRVLYVTFTPVLRVLCAVCCVCRLGLPLDVDLDPLWSSSPTTQRGSQSCMESVCRTNTSMPITILKSCMFETVNSPFCTGVCVCVCEEIG